MATAGVGATASALLRSSGLGRAPRRADAAAEGAREAAAAEGRPGGVSATATVAGESTRALLPRLSRRSSEVGPKPKCPTTRKEGTRSCCLNGGASVTTWKVLGSQRSNLSPPDSLLRCSVPPGVLRSSCTLLAPPALCRPRCSRRRRGSVAGARCRLLAHPPSSPTIQPDSRHARVSIPLKRRLLRLRGNGLRSEEALRATCVASKAQWRGRWLHTVHHAQAKGTSCDRQPKNR